MVIATDAVKRAIEHDRQVTVTVVTPNSPPPYQALLIEEPRRPVMRHTVTRAFPPELVDRVVATTDTRELRRRLLPARLVVYFVHEHTTRDQVTCRSPSCWTHKRSKLSLERLGKGSP